MSIYVQKLKRLKTTAYKNQDQIEAIIRVKNYIDVHYESDVNIDELSNTHFISKYHLIRLFKKYYGLTPRQYLINKRIEKAKEQLLKGLSVTNACFAVGFTSLGSFSTLFKSKTGFSPTYYQKEQLSRSK